MACESCDRGALAGGGWGTGLASASAWSTVELCFLPQLTLTISVGNHRRLWTTKGDTCYELKAGVVYDATILATQTIMQL
jgi:hypothetical protein